MTWWHWIMLMLAAIGFVGLTRLVEDVRAIREALEDDPDPEVD